MFEAAARVATTGMPSKMSADSVNKPRTAPRFVLRILTGEHTGAESKIRHSRVLIGNLDLECDIVLDVKREGRHACLVRVSEDGWTVLAVAGELWVDTVFIAPQQTSTLRSGQVLTLGRVAMCVADPRTIDWTQVRPPLQLVKPEADGPVPQAALPPSRSAVRQKWHALKLAAGLGLGALVLASASAYLSQAWLHQDVGPEAAALRLQANRTLVADLPFAKEVSVLQHPDNLRKLLVLGYVPNREHLVAISDALQRVGSPAELRVHAVDAVGDELSRRFEGISRTMVRYLQQGRFELETALEKLPAHDRQARTTLQELPAVKSLSLKINDVPGEDGLPLVVRYERSTERPGDLVVHDLDKAVRTEPPAVTVREVRLGDLPSVILSDGLRYFTEGQLPDGSTIASIQADRVTLRMRDGTQRELRFDQGTVSRSESRSATARKSRK
jgi:hypothetical protein